MKKYILYNSDSNGDYEDAANVLYVVYEDATLVNLENIDNYTEFFEKLSVDDEVILCGNDNILSQFVNQIQGIPIKNTLYFYSVGRNNDFVRNLGFEPEDEPVFPINVAVQNLPSIQFENSEKIFVSNVFAMLEATKSFVKNERHDLRLKVDNISYEYKNVCAVLILSGQFFHSEKMVSIEKSSQQDQFVFVIIFQK